MIQASSPVVDAFEAWWSDRNEQALFYYQYPVAAQDWSAFATDWLPQPGDASWQATQTALDAALADGDTSRFEHLLDLAEAQAQSLGFLGAGFPRYLPNCGPGIIAACISGYSRLHGGTMWFELGQDRDGMELDAIIAACDAGQQGTHAMLLRDLLQRAASRFAGRLPIAMTDLGGNLDLLSALHGAEDLLMDLIEEPEAVAAALAAIDRLWIAWYDELDAVIAPASDGLRGCWMQLLSQQPFYPLQCDFAAMLSPDHFGEQVRPSLQRLSDHLGRAVFHLDGPGMIGHLQHVCSVPQIHAVQWTPGAGQPDVHDPAWFDLYRRIIDAGRKVILLCFPPDVAAVRQLTEALPAREFYIHCEGPDAATGEALQRILDRAG